MPAVFRDGVVALGGSAGVEGENVPGFGDSLRDDIAAIHSPTLVLATWIGYKEYTDHPKTEANLHREYAKLEGVDIRITDTSRHFIMYDEPQWFFTQIDGFLGAK